jgi:rhodanese-related sulfurtransferase
MSLPVILIGIAAIVALFAGLWIKALREKRDLERHSITADALHDLLAANRDVLLFDVRQPLDLLAESEKIPGSRRIPPKEIEENATLIPRDRDLIVYCTCPSDRTSRVISKRAEAMNFMRVKFLKGGLAAWKEKGYPVEPYRETFHLDTAT